LETKPEPGESGCPCRGGLADPGRRSALGLILGTTGAMALGVVGLAGGFLSNALGRTRGRPWIRLGRVDDTDVLNVETFQHHVLQVQHVHAWEHRRVPLDIYIKDQYPQLPLALESTCSHLGCSVRWDAQATQFRCPCHGGTYDQQGNVIAGPPPRPLTRLEVKIEDGDCFVRMPGAGRDIADPAGTGAGSVGASGGKSGGGGAAV
jgi:nitrite reductase/ring-hydroxylating ferredoxin subunit